MGSKMSNSNSSRYAAVSIRYIPSCLQNKIKKTAIDRNTDFYRNNSLFCFLLYLHISAYNKAAFHDRCTFVDCGSVSLKHGGQDAVTLLCGKMINLMYNCG